MMNIRKTLALLLIFGFSLPSALAQRNNGSSSGRGARHDASQVDSWEVTVRQMPDDVRANITETMANLKGTDEDRGIIADIGSAVGMGLVSGLVDVVVSETYNLAQYRKKQKQEWMKMIQNENNFTDSITSIKGLKDFYAQNSHRGALDPSDINFDGIEIRGTRRGQLVIYLSCSIDRENIEHMFRHSKFNLVLDSLVFNPYLCHLPNMTANGIRVMKEMKKGNAQIKADTIIRPGNGGNGFSFDERNNLRVAVDFSIFSSWINQAVQIHKDVELGRFSFTVNIPDDVIGTYSYSRKALLDKASVMSDDDRAMFLADNLISIDGDSFVVPRSYMPLDNGRPMWGTGEYNIKVKVRESCQLADNSDKAKHWREDYKRLRQMQNRSSEVQEYFKTLWNQYGNTLVKSSYKTALSTGVNQLVPLKGTGSSAKSNAGSKSSQSNTATNPTGNPPAANNPK